jgi:hypothetical protein
MDEVPDESDGRRTCRYKRDDGDDSFTGKGRHRNVGSIRGVVGWQTSSSEIDMLCFKASEKYRWWVMLSGDFMFKDLRLSSAY